MNQISIVVFCVDVFNYVVNFFQRCFYRTNNDEKLENYDCGYSEDYEFEEEPKI